MIKCITEQIFFTLLEMARKKEKTTQNCFKGQNCVYSQICYKRSRQQDIPLPHETSLLEAFCSRNRYT